MKELKNIIDGLNNNLNSKKQQVAQQARQINQLQHEKDTLGQRLKDMQVQTAGNKQLKDTIAKLQQQLKCEDDFVRSQNACITAGFNRGVSIIDHKDFSCIRNSFQNTPKL